VALVMWNMRKRHFLIAEKHPQRGRQSRAHALCAFIGAKRRPLTATAAEGTRGGSRTGRPIPLRPFAFNTFTPQQPKVTPAGTESRTSPT